jgi:predicted aspartyl protease
MPYRGEEVGNGSVSFAAWPDGQFRVDAMVNGTPMMFIVDTGATNVVLTRSAWATLREISTSASRIRPPTGASWVRRSSFPRS